MKHPTVNQSLQDELLIQRCVDNELSTDDRRTFLRRLDDIPDGWKTLACGLLTERSVAAAVHNAGHPGMNTSPTTPLVVSGSKQVIPRATSGTDSSAFRRIWSHPVTSLALCAAIVVAASGIMNGYRKPASVQGTSVAVIDVPRTSDERPSAGSPATGGTRESAGSIVSASGNGSASQIGPSVYSVGQLPDGSVLKNPVQIPVSRNPQQFAEALQQIPDLQHQLDAGTIRIIRIPADNQQDLLFFVNERYVNGGLQ
jgi:hypothetical protein